MVPHRTRQIIKSARFSDAPEVGSDFAADAIHRMTLRTAFGTRIPESRQGDPGWKFQTIAHDLVPWKKLR
jgi:hypothetical protein